MQFDEVYQRLLQLQADTGSRYVHASEETLRGIYTHIVATQARDCLELGTAFGATTCIMAAAVEELGVGAVTTVDHIRREPVGVVDLAAATGLASYIKPVVLGPGYNWFLLDRLRQQTVRGACDPCYDFCFLDGAHFWETDALAALLAVRLLRPGGWLLLDDLNWNPKSHPGWEATFSHLSDVELNTRAVGEVFSLLLRAQPELGRFVLWNGGHMGWCRKHGGQPDAYLPGRVLACAVAGAWSHTIDGATALGGMALGDNVMVEIQGQSAAIRATGTDPAVQIRLPSGSRPIDYVTLRLCLLGPDMETLQLFWLGEGSAQFNEADSLRCTVRASQQLQDLTFCIEGSEHERSIKALRLDPGDGPCRLLVESVTFGSQPMF